MSGGKMTKMRERGYSNYEIAEVFGVDEKTVRIALEGIYDDVDDHAGALEEHSLQEISLEDVDPEESAFPEWRDDYLKETVYLSRKIKNLQNK